MPVDIFSMTQGDKRVLSFVSQAMGLMAELDVDTEHLRFMGDTWVVLIETPETYLCIVSVALCMASSEASFSTRAALSKSPSRWSNRTNRRCLTTSTLHAQRQCVTCILKKLSLLPRMVMQRPGQAQHFHLYSIKTSQQATDGLHLKSQFVTCTLERDHTLAGI